MGGIKLLLVDDHAVVRKGLHFFLRTIPEFEIVGEAQNGREAIEKVEDLSPDVVLMDLIMPEMNGVEATKKLKELHPSLKILVLTSMNDLDYILPAMHAGANGYMLKDMPPEQLVEAIKGAYSGITQLHPEITKLLLAPTVKNNDETKHREDMFRELTIREKEVLKLIALGMSNKEIANQLFIAEKTVKTHVSNILSKLELTDRTQAAIYAVSNGLSNESID